MSLCVCVCVQKCAHVCMPVLCCVCVNVCVCVCVCTHVCKTWTIGRMESTLGTHMAKQGDYAVRVGGGANEGRELVKRKNVQWSVWGGGDVQWSVWGGGDV